MAITTPAAPAANPTRRTWTAPKIECLEARPEITAYSGTGGPLALSNR